MRCPRTWRGAGGSCTSAATASTGVSPCIRTCPAPSRSVAARAASAPGRRSPASTTTPSTAATAASGGATGGRPQQLVGVGFTSQAPFEGNWYRRAPGAADPRAAWILEGVRGDIIGDFGLSGGGAAGFELDRADHRLGTPPNTIVVGVVGGPRSHPLRAGAGGDAHRRHDVARRAKGKLIRADMVYFEAPNGGAVFSVGSITFCGSLPHNNFDNDISRIVDNVLRRFRDT